MSSLEKLQKITLASLRKNKESGEKIACLTAYDAVFARILEKAQIDIILVGDSLGMVVQGWDTTIPVSIDEMVYHCACVSRSVQRPFIMADLPFMSYRNVELALDNATALMQKGGAHMLKLESGQQQIDIIKALSSCGIPVCAHLGLRPQWIHKLGNYQVQAKSETDSKQLIKSAETLVAAGADALLLECVPAELGKQLSQNFSLPVIGIGAGVDCDGQVLVTHDMLGISNYLPRFAKNFLTGNDSVEQAIRDYVNAVKSGTFPATGNTYC